VRSDETRWMATTIEIVTLIAIVAFALIRARG
jgi:hypothetical protein